MKNVELNVTAKLIDTGTRRDSHGCMIADAVNEQIPWAKYITVDTQSVRFTDTKAGRRFIYLTPPRAQKAILDYDSGKHVRPFRMTLSQGYTKRMRVRDPGYKEISSRHYTRDPNRVMPSRYREFGLRQLTSGAPVDE